MKNFLLILFLLPLSLSGQQLPYKNLFAETAFIFNPGMTAPWDYMEVGATYQQQWSAFEGAPQTMIAYLQVPMLKQNMSFGGSIMSDQVGLLDQRMANLNYAYKLRPNISSKDQLSIGIGASLNQVMLNGEQSIARQDGDPRLFNTPASALSPNLSFGLFYTSDARNSGENYLYAGLSAYSALPLNISLTDETNNVQTFERVVQANGVFGWRMVHGYSFIEPSISIDYSALNIFHALARIQFDINHVFWGGLGYSTNNTAHFNFGLTLRGGFLQDGDLRLGTTAFGNFSRIVQQTGIGYEFFLSYRFYFKDSIFGR